MRSHRRRWLAAFLGQALLGALIATGPLPAQAQQPQGQEVELRGTLNIIWASFSPKPPRIERRTTPEFLLTDDDGKFWSLSVPDELLTPEGGALEYNGERVRLQGTQDPETERVYVSSIELEEKDPTLQSHYGPTHRFGAQRWVSILCRFADSTGTTPQPSTYFDGLMSFMDDFWREVSYENINLTGSVVVGWVNMAQNRADYMDDPGTHFAGHTANLGELADDCTAAADPLVDFSTFDGINLMFNEDLDCCSWGGGVTLTRDGVTQSWPTTWMATWGWGNQDVLGQEMGHGFGLPHSSGPYGATYDSQWDVMSSGGTCSTTDPDYGCVGVHTIAYHKDALGWIGGAQRYTATTAADQLVTLERLALPTTSNPLEVVIPIGGSATNFYTVENRRDVGYDDNIPADAVVIHKVDTTLGDSNAQVVDATNDSSPNDAGARWVPGETFVDAGNSIAVKVLSTGSTTATIIINPEPPTADAGGPYVTTEGIDVSVSASASSDPGGDPLTYAWDLDDDGQFDDGTGVTETFQRVGRDGAFDACVEVTDDVGNTDTDCATVNVANAAPSVSIGSNAPKDEGSLLTVTGTITDAGWEDPLDGTIDWGDGTGGSVGGVEEHVRPDGTIAFSVGHRYGDDGLYTVEVCGADDDTSTCQSIPVQIDNVAPTVTIDPAQVAAILEGDTSNVQATFTDPGWLDTYSADISWGEGTTDPRPASVTTEGDPTSSPDQGETTGSHQYGDNGTFTITVRVRDDDLGQGSDAFSLTVDNVDPTAVIDTSGAVIINGQPVIVNQAGVPQPFDARSQDSGSDDLTGRWAWDDGTPDDVAISLVGVGPEPPQPPFATPDVNARDEQFPATHTFGNACIYDVAFSSVDDDAGTAADGISVIMQGAADRSRSTGWWHKQYKDGGSKADFDLATLECYLAIARFGSTVFDEARALGTIEEAHALFHKDDALSSHQEKLDKELLAAWLNFANGGFGWLQPVVDTDKDGAPDLSFAIAVATAEAVRLNPLSTKDQLEDQRKLLNRFNHYKD